MKFTLKYLRNSQKCYREFMKYGWRPRGPGLGKYLKKEKRE